MKMYCKNCGEEVIHCPSLGCTWGTGFVHKDDMTHYCAVEHTYDIRHAIPRRVVKPKEALSGTALPV